MIRKFWIVLIAITLALPLVCGQAGAAVEIAKGGIGDVLLFPLYDVRPTAERTDGWQNYGVVQNTSGLWTASHIRFRAWKYCMEVYDHVLLLSPFDVFTFMVTISAEDETFPLPEPIILNSGEELTEVTVPAGTPWISSTDTQTLINSALVNPGENGVVVDGRNLETGDVLFHIGNDRRSSGQGASWRIPAQKYILEDCGMTAAAGYDMNHEMQAGHLEVIGLFQLSPVANTIFDSSGNPCGSNLPEDTHQLTDVVRNNVYVDRGLSSNVTNVFDVQDALFYLPVGEDGAGIDWPANVIIEGAEHPTGSPDRYGIDCGNVLTGSLEMGDVGNGSYGVINAVALRDYRTCYDDNFASGERIDAQNRFNGGPHRDQYNGAAIVYPTNVMYWSVGNNGDYYINENWTITAGAGLRDGDNILGVNAPDEGDPGVPTNSLLDSFNNIWSLDDVENALRKRQITYQYFNMTTSNGATVDTDVVFTFPTKHYHYFFRDWPYYVPGSFSTPVNSQSETYNNACTNYRRRGADGTNLSIVQKLESETAAGYTLDGTSEGVDGNITAVSWIYDTDQNLHPRLQDPEDTSVPPGSPWPPPGRLNPDRYIPFETNIIRVGEHSFDTHDIDAANWLLDSPQEPVQGHFIISQFNLLTGVRDNGFAAGGHAIYSPVVPLPEPGGYPLPSIGATMFVHSNLAVDNYVRTAMSEWHYQEGDPYLPLP